MNSIFSLIGESCPGINRMLTLTIDDFLDDIDIPLIASLQKGFLFFLKFCLIVLPDFI